MNNKTQSGLFLMINMYSKGYNLMGKRLLLALPSSREPLPPRDIRAVLAGWGLNMLAG